MRNLFEISGKVVVVTGAYGVLASAIAVYLASKGCKMVLIGRNAQKGGELVSRIESEGGQAIFVEGDVLEQSQMEAALEAALKAYGTVDVLLNAAGGNIGAANVQPEQSIFDLDIDAMRRVADLNIFGTVVPTKVFLKPMVEKKSGVVINFCSMSSFRPLTRVAGYGIAKAGIASWTQWLAGELATKCGDGLRVNGIAPGFLLSDQNRALLLNPDGSLSARSEKILGHTPYGRFLEADELLGTIHYLISDASKAVTGTVSVVDGGFNSFSI